MASYIIKTNKNQNIYLGKEIKSMFRTILGAKAYENNKTNEVVTKKDAINSIDSLIEQSEMKKLTKDLKKLREDVDENLNNCCKYIKEFYNKYFPNKNNTVKRKKHTATTNTKKGLTGKVLNSYSNLSNESKYNKEVKHHNLVYNGHKKNYEMREREL